MPVESPTAADRSDTTSRTGPPDTPRRPVPCRACTVRTRGRVLPVHGPGMPHAPAADRSAPSPAHRTTPSPAPAAGDGTRTPRGRRTAVAA